MFARHVTGILDGTDLETTARYEGCGQATRKRKVTDKRGKVHEIEVTVSGWKLLVLIEAMTKIPLAAKVVQIQDDEVWFPRDLVTQARTIWVPTPAYGAFSLTAVWTGPTVVVDRARDGFAAPAGRRWR